MQIFFKNRDAARAFKNSETRKLKDNGKDVPRRWGVELLSLKKKTD